MRFWKQIRRRKGGLEFVLPYELQGEAAAETDKICSNDEGGRILVFDSTRKVNFICLGQLEGLQSKEWITP